MIFCYSLTTNFSSACFFLLLCKKSIVQNSCLAYNSSPPLICFIYQHKIMTPSQCLATTVHLPLSDSFPRSRTRDDYTENNTYCHLHTIPSVTSVSTRVRLLHRIRLHRTQVGYSGHRLVIRDGIRNAAIQDHRACIPLACSGNIKVSR